MGHSHRSSILNARGDLAGRFDEAGLDLDDYLHTEGGYGLNNVRVDGVEVLRLREDRKAVGALLATFAADPASVGFATGADKLWSRAAREGVAAAIAAATASDGTERAELEPPSAEPESERTSPEPPSAEPQPERTEPERTEPEPASSGGIRVFIVAAVLVVAVIALLVLTGSSDDSSGTNPPTGEGGLIEVSGGLAHTWSDYKTGEGEPGHRLAPEEEVKVSCRIRGFKVEDGNVWWYRIKSKPWNERFYATADAFYNDGERSGPLRETPFFDPSVPICDQGDAG